MVNTTKYIWKVIVAILFTAIMLVSVVQASPDWYDNNWSKRAHITVDNTGNPNTLTDYQIKIDVAYSSDMKPDFDDLRFTDSDGTSELSYWIQDHITSTSATVWVKVPTITGSSTKTIYMYYENPSASSASNGENTFLFFDDFSGTTLDTEKWETLCGGSGTATIVDDKLRLDSPTGSYLNDFNEAKVKTKMEFGDVSLEFKWQMITWVLWDNNNFGTDLRASDDSLNYAGLSRTYHPFYGDRLFDSIMVNGVSNPATLFYIDSMEGKYKIIRYSGTAPSSNIFVYYNDSLMGSCADGFTNNSKLTIHAMGSFTCPATTVDIDDVIIRKYTSSEPTTSVGVEEELSILAIIDIDPNTLNLISRGKWITAYIELPDGYDVNDIEVGIVELSTENGAISTQLRPTQVGDYDSDTILDRMVKFDMQEVIAIVDAGDQVEVTVTGEVAGTPFEGIDTIRVID